MGFTHIYNRAHALCTNASSICLLGGAAAGHGLANLQHRTVGRDFRRSRLGGEGQPANYTLHLSERHSWGLVSMPLLHPYPPPSTAHHSTLPQPDHLPTTPTHPLPEMATNWHIPLPMWVLGMSVCHMSQSQAARENVCLLLLKRACPQLRWFSPHCITLPP